MHYCIQVITREFPTDEVLEEVLTPFKQEDFYAKLEKDESLPSPPILWDWWQLGGRYGALLKIDVSGENAEKYNLVCYPKRKRSGRLFRSAFLEKANLWVDLWADLTETDALVYMGIRDVIIYADSAPIKDLKKCADGFGLILPTGEVFVRKYWDRCEWIENTEFDQIKEKALSDYKDCWISVIDIHN